MVCYNKHEVKKMRKRTSNIFITFIAAFCLAVAIYLLELAFSGLSREIIMITYFIFGFLGLVATALCIIMLIKNNRKDIEAILQRKANQKKEAAQARATERKASRIAALEKELEELKKDGE